MENQEINYSLNKIEFKNDIDDGLMYCLLNFLIKNKTEIESIKKNNPKSFKGLTDKIAKKFFDKFSTDFESLIQNENPEKLAMYLTMIDSSRIENNLKDGVLIIFKETQRRISNYIEFLKGNKSDDNGGCYIATMAYGDYDHPQVIELRNFRDDFLSKTIGGRRFIKFYYKYSPSLVEKLKNKQSINLIIRKGLNQFIKAIKK
ncbi:hypothetical protein ES677_09770 [Bizionia gelidisalsuginis]|uniref:Uncharacterized protein n=2 Tax=Bizionia TaxID=283785 RepID=A0A8H2QM91_9FLAO|nr:MULTISPECIES: CFI-box-CTERM domain-containing protein [Bizionia]TYB76812.1 hypothetical protein ES676_05580 [Bizionia saleffrena]TYC12044.1 hypothetical protein ES677_09770 [Bizionia gelidisalsuginis]